MYNPFAKKIFLKEYPTTGNQKIITRLFDISSNLEAELDKDIYNFSAEELLKLLESYDTKTPQSHHTTMMWISRYINWSIEKGFSQHPLNPLSLD